MVLLYMSKVYHSRKSDQWETPEAIYNYLDDIHEFDYDPCPLNVRPDFDGLEVPWGESNFVNPPYSDIKNWAAKAIAENKLGKKVILLLPSRTDTKYMQTIYEHGAIFTFIIGRLNFNGEYSAPFPSVIIELKGNNKLEMKYIERDVMLDE